MECFPTFLEKGILQSVIKRRSVVLMQFTDSDRQVVQLFKINFLIFKDLQE